MRKGIFCLSLDTELLWGRVGNKLNLYRDAAKKEREIIKKLLILFTKYKIPATWAVVGKLFLEGDPLWSAPDIIRLIKQTENQEIACHTLSHISWGKPQFSIKEAEKDLQICLNLARKQNIKFQSFVFPFDEIGYLEILKKYGFLCYRSPTPSWFNNLGPFKKIGQIIDYLLCLTPPVSRPVKEATGLIRLSESLFFVSAQGLRQFIPDSCRIIKAKKGLDLAIKKGMIFHLWFHPINLAWKTEELLNNLEEIFKYAAKLRKENKLEIKSMGQIAKAVVYNPESLF